jgi:hypothetical protein
VPPARRLVPRYIQKRSLPEVYGQAVMEGGTDGAVRELIARFLEPVQPQEPTFGEVLLLYRCAAAAVAAAVRCRRCPERAPW